MINIFRSSQNIFKNILIKQYALFSNELGYKPIKDQKQFNQKFQQHQQDQVRDLYAKSYRKLGLEATILKRQKVIIPIKRIRSLDDGLITLNNKKECPGLIQSRDEFGELNLVFDQCQIYTIKRMKDYLTQPVYVRIGDQEIRVTFQEIRTHLREHWIIQALMNRFIVGRPNKVQIPVFMKPVLSNLTLNRGGDWMQTIDSLTVYVYNDDYPARFEIDPTNITYKRPYRIGDLQNSLPEGIVLTEKYRAMLNFPLLKVSEDLTMKAQAEIDEEQETKTKEAEGEEEFQLQKKEKKKIQKKHKVRSLKKIVEGLTPEQKRNLFMQQYQ